MKLFAFLFLFGSLSIGLVVAPGASADGNEINFQIVKATANKVWRLNTFTGEISICALRGQKVVCTANAAPVDAYAATYNPAMAYHERKNERDRIARENRARDIERLVRALKAISSFFGSSMERP